MRINMKTIKSVYQQQGQQSRRKWMIVGLGVLALVYGGVLLDKFISSHDLIFVSDDKAVSRFEGGAIARDAVVMDAPMLPPSAKMTGAPTFRGNTSLLHTYAPSGGVSATAPSHTWKSTGTAMKVHTTSSANVHHIGSGSSVRPVFASSSNVSVDAFVHSTSAMVVPTMAWSSARSLSVDNTRAAQAAIIEGGTPEHDNSSGIRGVTGTPDDLFEDEQPIGDGLWVLLLLASGYGTLLLRRRRVKQE